jgi:hypothetical protein
LRNWTGQEGETNNRVALTWPVAGLMPICLLKAFGIAANHAAQRGRLNAENCVG